MRFQLPSSPSLRLIAGEVAIIVIGVLIALGAQEVVDNRRWDREVADFRQSVDAEVASNLATYQLRGKQSVCVARRLDELKSWLESGRTGGLRALTAPIGHPVSLSLKSSVWGSRDSSLMAHMPMQMRLDYGEVYDDAANNEAHRLDERAAWLALSEFDEATELRHEDLMRLRGLITRARFAMGGWPGTCRACWNARERWVSRRTRTPSGPRSNPASVKLFLVQRRKVRRQSHPRSNSPHWPG